VVQFPGSTIVYLLELPPELQQANEETFSALLIRHWGKGYLSESDQAEQAARARSLGLDAATVTRRQKQVAQDLQALISAHAASLPPVFEPRPCARCSRSTTCPPCWPQIRARAKPSAFYTPCCSTATSSAATKASRP
jgi:hypothetical protein